MQTNIDINNCCTPNAYIFNGSPLVPLINVQSMFHITWGARYSLLGKTEEFIYLYYAVRHIECPITIVTGDRFTTVITYSTAIWAYILQLMFLLSLSLSGFFLTSALAILILLNRLTCWHFPSSFFFLIGENEYISLKWQYTWHWGDRTHTNSWHLTMVLNNIVQVPPVSFIRSFESDTARFCMLLLNFFYILLEFVFNCCYISPTARG